MFDPRENVVVLRINEPGRTRDYQVGWTEYSVDDLEGADFDDAALRMQREPSP
jgi:hypothetical protein